MKKIIILLILCIALVGCASNKNDKEPYTEITYAEYKTMIENKATFILVIGKYECPHCIDFKETLREVVKEYDVDIKYIDVQKLQETNEEERKEFDKSITYNGTPETVFFEDGEQSRYNRIEGAKSYNKVVEKLKQNGYIK